MLQFNQYDEISEGLHLLNEKQIIVGKGAEYGQVVFLVGGAGSGKGFAKTNFMQGNKFKHRNVDDWKGMFLRIAALKNEYPELKNLDLKDPNDVSILHDWVKTKGIKSKTLNLMLANAKIGKLPNLLFDITFKEKSDIHALLPALMDVGYDPKNLHVIWVLTNYGIAVKQNRDPKRGRIVSDDIMLDTHAGASNNMHNIIKHGTPKQINGSVHIILGGKEHTVFFKDADGNAMDGKQKSKYGTDRVVIKDFKYLTLKEPGKAMTTDAGLRAQAMEWVWQNVPRTLKNKGIFQSEVPIKEESENLLPEIYCDLDSVLADFLKGTEKVLGKAYNDKEYWMQDGSGDKKELLAKKSPHLYRNLDWMPDGKKLWGFIKKHNPKILSAYPNGWMPNSRSDKNQWVKNNLGKSDGVHLVKRKEKRNYAINEKGQPNILIDDHPKNIKEWNAAGGVGVLHRSATETIGKLKKMGF